MNEILNCFFNPEISMGRVLTSREKWKDGIIKWILVAILSGLFTVIIYMAIGIDLDDIQLLLASSQGILQSLSETNINKGFSWLAVAGIRSIELVIIAALKTILWTIILYLISKLLKDRISIRLILNMSIWAFLTWIVAKLIGNVAVLVALYSKSDTINIMIMGLSTILEYWNLILMIIGYSILSRSNFFRSSVIVIIIQAIFWGISNTFPALQVILG